MGKLPKNRIFDRRYNENPLNSNEKWGY